MNHILAELAWRIRAFFLPDRDPDPTWALIGRVLLLGFIAAYGWWFHFATMAALGETYKFIHGINLPFHEAGHVIFSLSGSDFLRVLGGTLGQLLMPLVLGVAFRWKYSDGFSAALALWWFGQNLVDGAGHPNSVPID